MTDMSRAYTAIGRRTILRAGLGALGSPLLQSCAGLLPTIGVAPQIYVLTPKTTFPATLPTVSKQLLVDRPNAPAEFDTARIALSHSPTSIDYFADAAWSDRAPAMLQTLLIESFEQTGHIQAVSRDFAILRADYLLMSELRRFEALYAAGQPQPTILVRLLVRLVKMPERSIIGEALAERRATAAHNTMPAIVEAFDEALGGTMKELVEWTLQRMSADAAAR